MKFREKKPEKLSDLELIRELDRMIASAEAQTSPNPAAAAILESLHPAMKAAMPETVKKAKQNLMPCNRGCPEGQTHCPQGVERKGPVCGAGVRNLLYLPRRGNRQCQP